MSSSTPLRGRRGRDRRIAEEAERIVAERRATASPTGSGPAGPERPGAGVPGSARAAHGAGRRIPDLAALPPLLAGSGAFEALLDRIGPAGQAPPPGVGRHAGLVAVPHGAKSFLAAALALAAGERIAWIARDAEIGDRVADEFAAWLGDPGAVAILEPRSALAFERSELVADETAARVAALAAWRSGRARVLVAGVQALLQHTIDPAELPAEPAALRPGERRSQDRLLRELLALGYAPVTEVAGRGEVARRGGLIDVFPPSHPLPVRIEFFGDEIDSLRAFDPTDQRSVGRLERVELLPASEFLRPAGGGEAIAGRLGRLAKRLPERLVADLARWSDPDDAPRPHRDGPPVASALGAATANRALEAGDAAEVWAPILTPTTGLDHLVPGTLLVIDEPGEVADAADFLWRQADERLVELVELGELPKGWPPAVPGARDWKARMAAARTLELTWEAEPPNGAVAGRGLSSGDLFGWREPSLPLGRASQIATAVEGWRGGDDPDATPPRIVIASDQAARLSELLDEAGLPVAAVSDLAEPPPPGAVALVDRSLNGGFAGGPDGLLLVTDRELFGNVRVRRPKALRRVVPRDLLEKLEPGDLVVHIDHGIARHVRMLRRGGAGEDRDYVELEFAGGDRIYVPLEQIGRVSRYSGGEDPQLAKLGGGEWQRTKTRVRKAVTELAEGLLELYAGREAAPGHAFAPDSPWQSELEASFPYEETPDQLRSVLEVKADMERPRPMDRLVVGDVGYGKTEVALRAAFKAIQDGRQVAVLVPTTVLAAQHHATFGQRFAAFPVTVRLLSRFVSARDQTSAIAGLANGAVDLVIGTHRLLSRDVTFRDLGLVIVDEEQRFGVAAKERLKQLRREVDVLTLSATPIPRTLNLALAGVRDLSVIETPPEDRHPIQTRVAEASAGLVRDAILRELDRGGQVFYVHNRVDTIEAQAAQLRRMLPGTRIVVGHGQMAEGALEKVMLTFASGAADVLVCTTIIESGLDIPNANTIIIDRADTLGLAQLYQLRGRVGRSSRRAYAYLLYRRRERMSDEARKRLQAIFNASELGAGFQIALADLEIRGAGNILGAQQSGHMAAVGFDLYSQLLAEAVEDRKAHREGRPAVVSPPQALVDLPLEAYLPPEYVPDEAQKLELYRRLAKARTPGDLAGFRQEAIDRFGPMPGPVIRLVEVAELRLAAEAAGVASVTRDGGQLVVRFAGGLARATAMGLLADGLPGVRPTDLAFASNQVRVRLPRDPEASWTLTRAIVARLSAAPDARAAEGRDAAAVVSSSR